MEENSLFMIVITSQKLAFYYHHFGQTEFNSLDVKEKLRELPKMVSYTSLAERKRFPSKTDSNSSSIKNYFVF